MIKRFKCVFTSTYLETQFRESQISRNQREFTTFAVQLCLFLVFYAIYYVQKEAYTEQITAGCAGAIALVIIIKCVVDKYPLKIDFLLLIIQAIMVAIQSIDSMVEVDSEDGNESSLNFDWFYGFQACYFHLACLLQGYSFIYQSIGILGVFTFYVARYPAYTAEFVSVCVSFLSLIVGIIYMKYQQEIAKRTQFCENRERMKWNNMIDDMIDESIIIIKMDKSQDQLMIHQMNTTAKKNLEIFEDQDLRRFIRNLKTQKHEHMTVEKNIREILMNPEKINNKEIQSIMAIGLDKNYVVSILNYWMEQQLMVLMIVRTLQNEQISQQCQQWKYILQNSIDLFFTFIKDKTKFMIDLINPIIQFYILRQIFFQSERFQVQQSKFQHYVFNTRQIKQALSQYYGKKIEILDIVDCKINSNFNVINYIIVSLIKLQLKEQSKIFLVISKQKDQLEVKSIQIKIRITNHHHMPHQLKYFLDKPFDFRQHVSSPEDILINLMNKIQSKIEMKTVLNLLEIKYLLQIFGCDNKIQFTTCESIQECSFRIIDLNHISNVQKQKGNI